MQHVDHGYENHVISVISSVTRSAMAGRGVFERKFRQLRLLMWKNWLFSVSNDLFKYNSEAPNLSPLSLIFNAHTL